MAIQREEKMPYDPTEDLEAQLAKDAAKDRASQTGRSTRRAKAAPRATVVKDAMSPAQLQQSIEDTYTLLGGVLSAMPNPKLVLVGNAISEQAEKCAASIMDAAKKDPKFMRVLVKLFTAGAYSGVIMAHMPILMAIYGAVMLPDMETMAAQRAAGNASWYEDQPDGTKVRMSA